MLTLNYLKYRIFFTVASILIGTTLVTGCSSFNVSDPASPYYIPSPGSIVTIHQRLEIPPAHTQVFLQFGQIISKDRLDEYAVNCDFEITTLAEKPRYVEPGKYTVTRSTRSDDSIVQNPTRGKPVQLAGIYIGVGIGIGTGGFHNGVSPMFELVEMRLKSENPSDIKQLACRGAIDDPVNMNPPTLAEIREALGKYASIQVPEEKH